MLIDAAIARAFTLIYTLALLTLFIRIQLNVLGRRYYLSRVVSLTLPGENEPGVSLENRDDDNINEADGSGGQIETKYLTFGWWILHQGCNEIMQKVTAAVKDVFGPVNPREDLSLERLSELVVEVRKVIEGRTESERRCVTLNQVEALLTDPGKRNGSRTSSRHSSRKSMSS